MQRFLATVVFAAAVLLAPVADAQSGKLKDKRGYSPPPSKGSLYSRCLTGEICGHCQRSAGCCSRACNPLR